MKWKITLGRGLRETQSLRLEIYEQIRSNASVVIAEWVCPEKENKEFREVNGMGMVGGSDYIRALNLTHRKDECHWKVLSSRF